MWKFSRKWIRRYNVKYYHLFQSAYNPGQSTDFLVLLNDYNVHFNYRKEIFFFLIIMAAFSNRENWKSWWYCFRFDQIVYIWMYSVRSYQYDFIRSSLIRGVPQRSVLGLLQFCNYMSHDIQYHCRRQHILFF